MPTATRLARPELFERGVRGRELALAAVDEDQIGKRPALLEQLAVATQHDLVHRGEIVVGAGGWGWGLAARTLGTGGPELPAAVQFPASDLRPKPLIRNFR